MQAHPASAPAPLGAPARQWTPLGAAAPTALVAARTQLHHAAQVANAAAISLLPPEPDDSHTSFEWDARLHALVARPAPASMSFRFALRVADLSLAVVRGGEIAELFSLDGRSVADGFAWATEQVRRAGGDAAGMTMRRHFQIPGAPPDAAHPFAVHDGAAFAELAAYYGDADALLRDVQSAMAGASEVRCWPHHFDIATLVAEPGAERATIGIGLSPGDEHYAEPYLYVGPYPYPDTRALPALDVGRWHTEGWVGAALTASAIVAAGDAAAQAQLARSFVDGAVATVRRLRAGAQPLEGGA